MTTSSAIPDPRLKTRYRVLSTRATKALMVGMISGCAGFAALLVAFIISIVSVYACNLLLMIVMPPIMVALIAGWLTMVHDSFRAETIALALRKTTTASCTVPSCTQQVYYAASRGGYVHEDGSPYCITDRSPVATPA